jgi:predicted aconitase
LQSPSDFAALGVWAGKQVKNKIPYFTGIQSATDDQLKYLGAAMAASGAVAMYHVNGITPEAEQDVSGLEEFTFTQENMGETYLELNTGEDPDLIVFGCPHASLNEIEDIAMRLKNKKLNKKLWVCVSKAVKQLADEKGFSQIIEDAGGRMVCDTCMVVSPIERMGFGTTAVNSGKAACYLPGFCKQNVVFNRMEKILEAIQ